MIEHFILPEEGPLLRSARRSNGDTHQQEDRYHPSEISGRVPRLVNVTSRTAVSYALHLGANQILLESSGNDHGVREIIEDYRSGATAITVVRLCALLDSDSTLLSFQTVYRFLKESENVEQVVALVR